MKGLLRQIASPEDFIKTKARIDSFPAGAGTVLFYEDQGVIAKLKEKYAIAAAEWNLPASWKLRAQMPFGSNKAETAANPVIDDEIRFRRFG